MPDAPATIHCRAILFDMDGTLVDSGMVIVRAWHWWAARHGVPVEPILAVEKGRPNIEVLRQFAPPNVDVDAEAQRFLDFELNDTDGIVPIPGAREAVRAAQPGPWAIVTSAERNLTEVRLRATGIPLPAVIVSADSITRGKPDPECYLQAAHQLGVPPVACLVFEDAPAGVASARAAGMTVVAVLTTLLKSELPADAYIKDFRAVSISHHETGFRVELDQL